MGEEERCEDGRGREVPAPKNAAVEVVATEEGNVAGERVEEEEEEEDVVGGRAEEEEVEGKREGREVDVEEGERV